MFLYIFSSSRGYIVKEGRGGVEYSFSIFLPFLGNTDLCCTFLGIIIHYALALLLCLCPYIHELSYDLAAGTQKLV